MYVCIEEITLGGQSLPSSLLDQYQGHSHFELSTSAEYVYKLPCGCMAAYVDGQHGQLANLLSLPF
jgi:hypothetical protein